MKTDPIQISEFRKPGKFSINVVSAIDEFYLMPFAIMLHSLLSHLDSTISIHLHILVDGVNGKKRGRLERIVANHGIPVLIEWIETGSLSIPKLPREKSSHFRKAAYLRLFVGLFLPVSVEKFIYLDADLLIEEDLTKLLDERFEGKSILAVRDFGFPDVASGLPNTFSKLGFLPDTPYFNSGVMVIDLKRWREKNLGQKARRYLEEYFPTIRFADQDVLNAIVADDWRMLDEHWNVQIGAILNHAKWKPSQFKRKIKTRLESLVAPPCILHFVGPWKPWHPGLDNRLQRRYFRYLRTSGWFNYLEFYCWIVLWFVKGLYYSTGDFLPKFAKANFLYKFKKGENADPKKTHLP